MSATYSFNVRPVTLCDRRGRPKLKRGKMVTHRWPPSLNTRLYWRDKSFFTKQFREQAWASCKEAGIRPFAGRASINFCFHSCREIDRDNRYSSTKALVDGIVDAGVVPNDTDRFVDVSTTWIKSDTVAAQRCVVTITQLP